MALAGTVIASHYAEPLPRRLSSDASLLAAPGCDAEVIRQLPAGTEMRILDRSRGWAWGYVDDLVGYVPASVL